MYNLSKTYTNQLESGVGYLQLNPVIALTIKDFSLFKNTEKGITRFALIEKEEGFVYREDVMEMVFVELPKLQERIGRVKKYHG